jgi:hypothetical protein
MKVKELIEELGKFNGELEVITEGCDCFGGTDRLEIFQGHLVIARPPIEAAVIVIDLGVLEFPFTI